MVLTRVFNLIFFDYFDVLLRLKLLLDLKKLLCSSIVLAQFIFFSSCSNDDDVGGQEAAPIWNGISDVRIITGVAGSYSFPELDRGVPECECSLVFSALPEWASLSGDCVLSWTSEAAPATDPIILQVEARNNAGVETSEPFELRFFSTQAAASIIFEETFDDQPEWSQRERCLYDDFSSDCDNLIDGWDYLYTDDKNPTHDPFYIEEAAARGGSGKGYHQWDESRGDDSRWKSEGQLAKKLSRPYQELWFSFWIKFNPNAQWEGGSESTKVFRAGALNPKVMDGTAGTSVYNVKNDSEGNKGHGRTSGGWFVLNVVRHERARTRLRASARCNRSYKCGEYDETWDLILDPDAPVQETDWPQNFGDDKWHKIEVHFAMNSAPGVGDGILEVFYDNERLGGRDDVPWKMEDAESWIEGINLFAIAGNSENVWAGDIETENSPEQSFYFLDDIKVCTKRCP